MERKPRKRRKEMRRRLRERRKNRLRHIVANYKIMNHCFKCHDECHDDKTRLEFHHRNPKEKTKTIFEAVRNGWSLDRLVNEMNKCLLLCNDCHKDIHKFMKIMDI